MKKFIMQLAVFDEKDKRKAMKIVSALPGIDEISIDLKGQKLTIIGTVDPVSVVSKLRKFWQTSIILVGPKEEPKKEEPKKEEGKKEEPKKEEPKKEEPPKEEPKKEDAKKEEEPKKEEPKKEDQEKKEALAPVPVMAPLHGLHPGQGMYPGHGLHPGHGPLPMPVIGTVMPYRQYHPPMQTYYYEHYHSMEENPNACVIS